MKMIFRYLRVYWASIALVMGLKLTAAFAELMLPYILEHMIDVVVPEGNVKSIFLWGLLMVLSAVITWQLNLNSNRQAVNNAHNVSYDVRRDLFNKTIHLSGRQFDQFTLPSLTSRMTSDSYNVQNFVRALQTLCVRAPIMLLGGIATFAGLFVLYAGISFFTLEGLEFMNIFTDGSREFGKYPISVYGEGVLKFCTYVIPVALFQYYPLLYLIGSSENRLYCFLPLLCLVFVLPCYAFFRYGLQRYQSSGS